MNNHIKKVLITGASRGIGLSIASELKARGYFVIGTSTTKKGVKKLTKKGILGLELNLNSDESISIFFEEIKKEHSNIDVLVNNAGTTRDNIVLKMKDDEWMDVINVHLNGTFKITKKILRFMLKNHWGRVINITSTSASLGNRGQSNYAASKSGIEAFSKSLAKEVSSRGITVNAIAPGYIQTDMTNNIMEKSKKEILKQIPLARFGKPREIADLVVFLVSDSGSYITGQTIHINGGLYM